MKSDLVKENDVNKGNAEVPDLFEGLTFNDLIFSDLNFSKKPSGREVSAAKGKKVEMENRVSNSK